MKTPLSALLLFLVSIVATAQTANHKIGITSGGCIQQYNGNLGSSFFKFNTSCFGAEVLTFGYYLDRTFDFNVSASIGDYGYCQPASEANKVIPISQRCPGCRDKSGMGELRSRMFSGNIALKYKFANGTIFQEDSKIAPYVYVGMGINYLTDRMKRQCVNTGNHFSVNGGSGFKYNINEQLNIGYNLGIGYFTKDKVYASVNDINNMKMKDKNDKYMQHTLFIGINL